jgi:hypothetical protein
LCCRSFASASRTLVASNACACCSRAPLAAACRRCNSAPDTTPLPVLLLPVLLLLLLLLLPMLPLAESKAGATATRLARGTRP